MGTRSNHVYGRRQALGTPNGRRFPGFTPLHPHIRRHSLAARPAARRPGQAARTLRTGETGRPPSEPGDPRASSPATILACTPPEPDTANAECAAALRPRATRSTRWPGGRRAPMTTSPSRSDHGSSSPGRACRCAAGPVARAPPAHLDIFRDPDQPGSRVPPGNAWATRRSQTARYRHRLSTRLQ